MEGLIIGRNFAFQNGLGLAKQPKTLQKQPKQSMGLYLGGLIIRRTFVSEIWGAYFQEGLFFFLGWGGLLLEFYGIPKVSLNYDINVITFLKW